MIDDYLPHRASARMIDRLVEVDQHRVVVEADVTTHTRLVREGALPTWAAIEMMAQAVAVWAGARSQRQGRPPRLGFLLGSRRYEILEAEIAVGSTLRIEACCDFVADNGLGMFSCSARRGEALVARAQISVFEPENHTEVLAP